MRQAPRDLRTIGGRLTVRRTRAGMSQADLARVSGVTQSHISQIERGIRTPNLSTLAGLAKGLRCRIGDLADEPRPKRAA